ncbi:MAG TPA: type II secretion system protein [Chthoniobacterales bacterium]
MKRAFSLVEVLAAVALVGILVFLALPNIVQVKTDSESHLAVARAEALNLAMASYVQALGSTAAESAWDAATTDQARYTQIAPYLAYAPTNLAAANGSDGYMPDGYSVTFPTTLVPLSKATLYSGTTQISY